MPTVIYTNFTIPLPGTGGMTTSSTWERRYSFKSSNTAHPTVSNSPRMTSYVTSLVTSRGTDRTPTVNGNGISRRFTRNDTTRATVKYTEHVSTDSLYQYSSYTTELTNDVTHSVDISVSTDYSYTAGRTSFQYRTTTTSSSTKSSVSGYGSTSYTATDSRRGTASLSYSTSLGVGSRTVNSTTRTTLSRFPVSHDGTKTSVATVTYTDRTSTVATETVTTVQNKFVSYYVSTRGVTNQTIYRPETHVANTDFFYTRRYLGDTSAAWGRLAAGTYSANYVPRKTIAYSDYMIVTDNVGYSSKSYQSGAKAWGYGSISRTCLVSKTETALTLGTGTNGFPLTETVTITRTETKATFYEAYGEPVDYSYVWSQVSYKDIRVNYPGYYEKHYLPPTVTVFFPGNFGVLTHTVYATASPYCVFETSSYSTEFEDITTSSTVESTQTQVTADSRYSETQGAKYCTLAGEIPYSISRVYTLATQDVLWGDGTSQNADTLEFRGIVYTYRSSAGFAACPGGSVGSNLDGGPFTPTASSLGSTSLGGASLPVFFGAGTAESAGIKYTTTYLGSNEFSYHWSGGDGTTTIGAVGAESTFAMALALTPSRNVPKRSTIGPYTHDVTLTFVMPSYSYSHFMEFQYTSLDPADPVLARTQGLWRIMPWEPAYSATTFRCGAGNCLLIAANQAPVVTFWHYTTMNGLDITYNDWNQTFNFDPWEGL
ncbi:MAG: hypothetical protein BWY91_01390 [bacterium ADurb.BinA028]|nr:MAG: hypothetical protein BWY91_01390 [bacterium ADurb.BinA028]